MQCFDNLRVLPQDVKGAVIAVGNFDGVHRGHQALLREARGIADKLEKKLGVLTFEPHPRRLFRPGDPPFRLTPLAVKKRRLDECGIDLLFSLPFDWDFASQSAEQFIDRVLKDSLAPAHIIVGKDFCFGQLRKGNPETLKESGLAVDIIEKVVCDEEGDSISSSRIRQSLRSGDTESANRWLGWPWEIEGAVVRGDRRGRELGFPTANVGLGETLHPAYGVYASLVKIGNGTEWLPSATNIGIRPMFELAEGQMETFIFDFDRDIYGQSPRVRPVKRLRGEAKFENLAALIAQMKDDCEQARRILKGKK
jgi:riboflavin kinase / FMN adenylyltransferase